MTIWGLVGGLYGVTLAAAALIQPVRRRPVAFGAALAFALVSLGSGTLVEVFWVNLTVPGALLLTGYWLSGLFFHDPQCWLEDGLLRVDRRIGARRWMPSLPRAMAEVLELSYAMVYPLVGGGAMFVGHIAGLDAVSGYWGLVLASGLASYATIPWLRSRPPRAIEPHCIETHPAHAGAHPAHLALPANLVFRRLNTAILHNASIQANTLPSGHVACAVAAALSVTAVDQTAGAVLLIVSLLIAVAAVAGRYHYVVDCVAGAAVPFLVSSLM